LQAIKIKRWLIAIFFVLLGLPAEKAKTALSHYLNALP
jgi:hypothetical protein